MTDTYLVRETSIRDKALWTKGLDHGRELEQQRIIELIRMHICFDYKFGDCEHQACSNYGRLARQIKEAEL